MWRSLDLPQGEEHNRGPTRQPGLPVRGRRTPMSREAIDSGRPPKGKPKPSRRELIAGAAGALGVLAVKSAVKIPAAQATQGKPIIAGQSNDETSPTVITNSGTDSAYTLIVQGPTIGTGVLGEGGTAGGYGLW